MASRKKSRLSAPAKPVPQSREEVAVMIAEMGNVQRKIDEVALNLGVEIASLKADAEDRAKPLADELQGYFDAIQTFAEANKDDLLDGKRRTVKTLQGEFGWRWQPPAVVIASGYKVEQIIADLRMRRLRALIRLKAEIDKEAILRDPKRIDKVKGLTVEQVEVFFVKPDQVEAEQLATVQKLKGAAAVKQPEGVSPKKSKAA